MYRGLWKLINRVVNKENVLSAYLGTAIVGWTAVVTCVGLGLCSALGMAFLEALPNSICAGLYAGIVFGLIGSILYLQRNPSEMK